jgi:hypothetical protein
LLGHIVNRVPRDQWKAYVDNEEVQTDWVLPKVADINIIAKWHHFNDEKYIKDLKSASEAPVFYWVWDYMFDPEFADWHINLAKAADLYLSGELGLASKYKELGVKFYYFQMDVCDGAIPRFESLEKIYDVVFTGSCIGQGNRIKLLTEINKQIPITIFSWNHEEWHKLGFKECYPPVYGEAYNKVIALSKIVLGISVENKCYGYWSNRVGKVLRAGGNLLQEWTPGMETLLPSCVDYFTDAEEAVDKIKSKLDKGIEVCYEYHEIFTSKNKMKSLTVLIERFLKGDSRQWLLP